MLHRTFIALVVFGSLVLSPSPARAQSGTRELRAASGGTLNLELKAGGTVQVFGDGGSSVSVTYSMACTPDCDIAFDESGGTVTVSTRFTGGDHRRQSSDIDLEIHVPSFFDVEIDSVGGGLSLDGVEGEFRGRTMGGELTLHDVRGKAELTTMGGKITLTDSELDGDLKTMGGEVLFENVVGDVRGRSMGGNVRYRNVQRRGGDLASPERLGEPLDDVTPDSVQISTMGGEIKIEDAPEGADLHTMGGNIRVRDAERFVRAKTMGGDIEIEAVDGWVQATTMGGDIDVQVTGSGGDVALTSMSGDIILRVPSGFGMDLDLEIAFTRNSRQEYRIDAPGRQAPTVTSDWDYEHGTPRKYVRSSYVVNGGGNRVKVRTVNGNITVREGR